jgi:bacteriocin biosynthesis cyclodehydratase domain-containing protein
VRPIIRPGLRILRRDVRTLQIGMGWPGVTWLPDSPALQAVLDAIDGFRDSAGVVLAAAASGLPVADCSAALDQLIDVGAVVDRSASRRPDCGEPAWAALWLLAGRDSTAAEIFGLRRSCRVHVSGDGPVAEQLSELLPQAHLSVADDAASADLWVLADVKEPPRRRSDDAMRSGLPHVWGYLRDVVGVVGPFVVPGTSACLRCVDRTRTELDPVWFAATSSPPSPVPPIDPILAAAVAALVAQDIVLWARGHPPQSLDAVVEIAYDGRVERHSRPQHPECGCGWLPLHDTMGA